MKYSLICLSAGIALMAPAATSAQGAAAPPANQTVDNALGFLEAVMPGTRVRTSKVSGYGRTDGTTVHLSKQPNCASYFKAHYAQVISPAYPEMNYEVRNINWSDVADVTAKDDTVKLTFLGTDRIITFIFTAESMAARAGYAMLFLKHECDKLSKYGF